MAKANTPYARQILAEGEVEEGEKAGRLKQLGTGDSLDHLSRPYNLTEASVKGDRQKKHDIVAAGFAPGMVKKVHIDALLNRGYSTIYNELERLFLKSVHQDEKGTVAGLTPTETKQFAEYIKAARMLASEEREQRKADRIEDMTEDELREMAAAILGEKDE